VRNLKFEATILDVHPKKKDPEDCAQIEVRVTTFYNSELMLGLGSQLGETVSVTIEPVLKVQTEMEIPPGGPTEE
jgi:hypothetical protein